MLRRSFCLRAWHGITPPSTLADLAFAALKPADTLAPVTSSNGRRSPREPGGVLPSEIGMWLPRMCGSSRHDLEYMESTHTRARTNNARTAA